MLLPTTIVLLKITYSAHVLMLTHNIMSTLWPCGLRCPVLSWRRLFSMIIMLWLLTLVEYSNYSTITLSIVFHYASIYFYSTVLSHQDVLSVASAKCLHSVPEQSGNLTLSVRTVYGVKHLLLLPLISNTCCCYMFSPGNPVNKAAAVAVPRWWAFTEWVWSGSHVMTTWHWHMA